MTFAHIRNIEAARNNLTQFVLRKADEIAKKVGFGYVDKDMAPSNFNELQSAYEHSKRTGFALPVWNGCSENTIYANQGGNFAFRFWHDVLHCVLGKGFSTAEEIAIGAIHVQEVQNEFGYQSLEALLMYADTIGQSIYASANNGESPENQLEWVTEQIQAYMVRLEFEKQFKPEQFAELAIA